MTAKSLTAPQATAAVNPLDLPPAVEGKRARAALAIDLGIARLAIISAEIGRLERAMDVFDTLLTASPPALKCDEAAAWGNDVAAARRGLHAARERLDRAEKRLRRVLRVPHG